MDFLKIRFYIELMSIAFGVVGILYIVPMQIVVDGQPRVANRHYSDVPLVCHYEYQHDIL